MTVFVELTPDTFLCFLRQRDAGWGDSRFPKKRKKKKVSCVSDMPTETAVMIIDNCEKHTEGGGPGRRGGICTRAIPWAIVGPPVPPPPPTPALSTPSMFYGWILLPLPGSPRGVKWASLDDPPHPTPGAGRHTWALPGMVFLFGSKHAEVRDLLSVSFAARSYTVCHSARGYVCVRVQVCVWDFLKRDGRVVFALLLHLH